MTPAYSDFSSTLTFHEVLVRWGPAYLAQWGRAMPARQREVLATLLSCRTPRRGGQLWRCPDHPHYHYVYHSCNDRHCPQCGQGEAQEWLDRQFHRLLLPVDYFLITFTAPEALRRWLRSHPKLGYDQFYAASAQALQDLARNPQRLGAQLGFLGVLHTSSRTLIYHPHIHYLVPGGGLSLDGCHWVAPKRKFLLHHDPLADHFRNLFRQRLEQHAPAALPEIAPKVWRQRWVVDVEAVGNGENALRYLGRYVFHTATGNRRLPLLPDGRLRWTYRDSRTHKIATVDLEPFELLRRFLQHVLPPGYSRVRYFGWLSPAARQKANRLRVLLGRLPQLTAAEQAAWQPPADSFDPVVPEEAPVEPRRWLCPHCQRPLILQATWLAGQYAAPATGRSRTRPAMKTKLHPQQIEGIGRSVAGRWGLLGSGFRRSEGIRHQGQRKHGVLLVAVFGSLSRINHGIDRAWDLPILLKPPLS